MHRWLFWHLFSLINNACIGANILTGTLSLDRVYTSYAGYCVHCVTINSSGLSYFVDVFLPRRQNQCYSSFVPQGNEGKLRSLHHVILSLTERTSVWVTVESSLCNILRSIHYSDDIGCINEYRRIQGPWDHMPPVALEFVVTKMSRPFWMCVSRNL